MFSVGKIILFVIAVEALFFSCARQNGSAKEDSSPLFKKVSSLQQNASWAYEIEGERLSKKISSVSSIANQIPLSPDALIALDGGFGMAGVYPELQGFASLDTSDLRGELLSLVNGFSSALLSFDGSDSSKIDSYWTDETLYSLALFLWDSGIMQAETGGVVGGQNAGVEKISFTECVVGKPFLGEDLIEIPVRWTLSDGRKIYTKIYPLSDDDGWKIQQIEIYKTEE